jgi:hypothetical protein
MIARSATSERRAPGESAAQRPPWLSRLLFATGLLVAGTGLFTLYLRQSRIAPVNADGASVMLQAQAVLHGNVLLSGWWTADVSFYTTELPEYMLVQVFRGLRPDVVHICGALSYTLTVLLAALLARGRATGRAGAVRALLAAGILLAPGILGGTQVFLENPDHAGTAVPILAMLLFLDRAPERWYVPVVVCGLLAWIQVGDKLSLVAATAPVAVVSVARLVMLGVRKRPLAEFRFDALLLAAAGLSVEVARLAEAGIRVLGGFRLTPLPTDLRAPLAQTPANARMLGQIIMLLFGANSPGRAHQQIEIITRFHLIGLALAAAGLAVGIAAFCTRRADRVSQILVVATLATAAAGVFSTLLPSLSYAHEVAILLPFGAVLAGRMLPFGAVLAGRMLPPLLSARWRPGRVAVPMLAAWLAAGLAALCFAATWAPMAPPDQALANWLTAHRYTEGLAAYWQANATTVVSGGRVLVAPITAQATSVRHWEASASWYDPSRRNANFVIAVADTSASPGGLSTAAVRSHFGRPVRQYLVGQNVIMVYDYNLLTRLAGRGLPGPHQQAPPRTGGPHQQAAPAGAARRLRPPACGRSPGTACPTVAKTPASGGMSWSTGAKAAAGRGTSTAGTAVSPS